MQAKWLNTYPAIQRLKKYTFLVNLKKGLNNISADDVINKLGEKELAKIFKVFGEEKNSNIISKKIISYRKNKNIETEALVKIINSLINHSYDCRYSI